MRIGELAKLTNTKVETIRYYEKEGILRPGRKDYGTFREYNLWDVLELMEILKYRHIDFSLQEVKSIVKDGSFHDIVELMERKEKKLAEEATNKILLSRTVNELKEKIRNAPLNVGNFWYRTDEAHVGIVCTERFGDHYKEISADNAALAEWIKVVHLTKPYIRFSINELDTGTDHNTWYHVIDANSFEQLKLPKEKIVVFPKRDYLHTIIDLGEKLQLSIYMIEPIVQQLQEKGLVIDGDILGELLIRFYENGKWHRYVELMIPIKNI